MSYTRGGSCLAAVARIRMSRAPLFFAVSDMSPTRTLFNAGQSPGEASEAVLFHSMLGHSVQPEGKLPFLIQAKVRLPVAVGGSHGLAKYLI